MKLKFSNGYVRQALREAGIDVQSHTAECRRCRLDTSIPGGRLVDYDHDCVPDADFASATAIADPFMDAANAWVVEQRVASNEHWDVVTRAQTKAEAIVAAKLVGGTSTGVRIGVRGSDHRTVVAGS